MDFVSKLLTSSTEHWSTFALASIVLLVVLHFGTKHARLLRPYSHLPGPRPWPFLNRLPNLLKVRGEFHLEFDEYYKKYGKLFVMTTENVAFGISEPEMIKQVLVKDFDSFCDRMNLFDFPAPLDSLVSMVRGDRWRRIRNVLSPSFSALKMKRMVPLMNDACDTFMKKLEKVADKDESCDIHKFVQSLTFDVILSTAFGVKSECQTNPDDPVNVQVRDALRLRPLSMLVIVLALLLPCGRKLLSLLSPWLFQNFKGILNVAKQVISATKEQGELSEKNLLELMLKSNTPGGKGLSDDEVAAQAIGFLLAGSDTTSMTLSLTCHYLATNPEIQEKLMGEIDAVWVDEHQMPSYDTVRELPYLDMVIAETLRLHPVVPFLLRECTRECKVKDLTIPKQGEVFIPIYSIQRDPNIWPNPEKFDPERFSPEAKKTRDPYMYLPFGSGPRSCIGMRFANMELKLVLTRLLKKYRLEVSPDTVIPPRVKTNFILTIDGGINVRLKSRC